MKSLVTLLLAASFVASCAPTAKKIITPNGNAGYVVECSGNQYSWADCYKKAYESCKGKYRIIDKNESSRGLKTIRSMAIECE